MGVVGEFGLREKKPRGGGGEWGKKGRRGDRHKEKEKRGRGNYEEKEKEGGGGESVRTGERVTRL